MTITQQHRSEAVDVIRQRTPPHAMPRSAEYTAGMGSGVAWVLAGRPRGEADKCPHDAGSAACDAWLAGWDRGKETGLEVLQEIASGRPLLDQQTLESIATMESGELFFSLVKNGLMTHVEDPQDNIHCREVYTLALLALDFPDASEVDTAATLTALHIACDNAMNDHLDNLESQHGLVETWFSRSGTIALEIPVERVGQLSEPGAVQDEPTPSIIADLIKPQLDRIRYARIEETLREYGAWKDDELEDEEENYVRLVWLACWDLKQA